MYTMILPFYLLGCNTAESLGLLLIGAAFGLVASVGARIIKLLLIALDIFMHGPLPFNPHDLEGK